MPRFLALLMTLAFCSTAIADPVTYICQRPAWDGKKGCGPNDTYYTYRLQLDTKDFEHENPEYIFQQKKGCDARKGGKHRYRYAVSDETIAFKFMREPRSPSTSTWSVIYMDRETMKATMSGVKDSPNLVCHVEQD